MKDAFKDVPSVEMPKEDKNIVDFIVEAGISSSKRQAREDVTNGAISFNGEKVTDTALCSRMLMIDWKMNLQLFVVEREIIQWLSLL